MGGKPSSSILWVAFLFGMLEVMLAADTKSIFEDWQRRMRVVQQEIEQRLYSDEIRPCACSYHACISQPEADITRCLHSSHVDSLQCSREDCGYTKLSTSHAYVRVPQEVNIGFYSDGVNRDICLTEGLAESFKRLRGNPSGFAPWAYFGASETGVFVSWPGKPREILPGDQCRPYDPRLRPWWRYTSWQNRNVVILLGASRTMELNIHGKNIKRWDQAISMTEKFLKTLSDQDTVQIVLFGNQPQTLLPDTGMMPATPENLKKLEIGLKKARPRKERIIDIGKALEETFKLLGTISDTAKLCENHIVLFTDRRDCTSSSEPDCAAKKYFKTETAEFVATGIADSIQFAQNLHGAYQKRLGRTTLFAYSLAPDASTFTGQLACRLGGIHVDLERELREHSILDPLHLMRGYFMTAAARVEKSSGSTPMAVSEIYEDDGGLGALNTFVMPVYFHPKPHCPRMHYGNIGIDIPVSYYADKDINWLSKDFNLSVSNWNYDQDLLCNGAEVKTCQMQVIRGQQDQCVYPIDEKIGKKCFTFKSYIYSVDYDYRISQSSAMAMCKESGGELIAPQNLEERQFLATLAPPDGAWIDLIQSGSKLHWPDGTEMEDSERRNVQRTCVDDWVAKAFYMDARNFKHNIQCSQAAQPRPAICRFPIDDQPDACTSNITREVSAGDYNNTIKTCEMEACMWDSLPTTDKNEQKLLCNRDRKADPDINTALCCDDVDLDDVCHQGQDTDDSENTALLIGISVVAIVGAVMAFVCICCICQRARFFQRKSHQQLLSSDALTPQRLVEIPQKLKNSIRSPFASVTTTTGGKRPELVMNIDVKVLDNGWEKVGGYGRVRQGEYIDGAGSVHQVAVKFVDALAPEAAWEALKNEFDILSSIPLHPNIVKPFGAHWGDRTEHATRYIVEELMHTNLGDLMKEVGPCPAKPMVYRDWVQIFIGIASGLDHLHQYKIIHFDLKPRNVLLDENLTVKIADFGCSKSKFDTYIELSKMAGTPPYLAPECWMLYYAQNCRTEVARIKIDVYSFGVIMWECLNGGSSLQTPLYKRPTASNSSSKSTAVADHIEIRRENKSSETCPGSNASWEIQYHLSDEIPVSLRDLVNACVRLDFDARPTTSEILEILKPMLETEWINAPLPWKT